MEASDFRSIGRATQEELRRRALFLIERQGLSQGQAARLVGVHRQTVNTWVKRHRERGEDGVLDGRRVLPRRGKQGSADGGGGRQGPELDRRRDARSAGTAVRAVDLARGEVEFEARPGQER